MVPELRQFGQRNRDRSRELVEGEVEDIKVPELAEEVRDRSGETVPVHPEGAEFLELGDLLGDGSREVGLLAQVYVLQVRKVTDLRRYRPREAAAEGLERDHAVASTAAFDDVPFGAAVGVGLPRGQDVGVVEGFLDLEEGFFVIWVAELGE